MSRLNVEIRNSIYQDFVRQVALDGRSSSDVVRELILAWLEKRILEKERIAQIRENKNDGSN
jgi:Arc/MetJ-type ribon-helix-helix transcriptional regulator